MRRCLQRAGYSTVSTSYKYMGFGPIDLYMPEPAIIFLRGDCTSWIQSMSFMI